MIDPVAPNAPFIFDPRLLADPDGSPVEREAEWRRVYRHFDPRLRTFFARRVLSADALDALMAEIWRRALLRIGRLQSPAAGWSWLTTVGVNLLRDQRRRVAAEARRTAAIETEIGADAAAAMTARLFEDLAEDDMATLSATLLALLTPADRRFLHLFAIDELTHQEIAEQLGLPSAAAGRQRLRRIRQQLREVAPNGLSTRALEARRDRGEEDML